jgi:hypothetical protein
VTTDIERGFLDCGRMHSESREMKSVMKSLTALAVAIVATAAMIALLYFYERHESFYKARMEGLAVRLPTWTQWRIKIHDWIANFWYLPVVGVFITTFVVTTIGLRRGEPGRE